MAERNRDMLRDLYNHGGFGLARSKPQEFLNGLLQGTLGGQLYLDQGLVTSDLATVLSPDYLERRKQGTAPLLLCERIEAIRQQALMANAESDMMAAEDPQMIVQPVDVPEAPPMMWVYLMQLPLDTVPTWVVSDLRRLMRAHERRRASRPEPEAVVSY